MKKTGLFLIVMFLLVFVVTACNDNTETPKDNEEEGTKNPTEVLDLIEIIKQGETLTLTEGESKEYDLTQYISYSGSEFSFSFVTENKNIVNATLNDNKLTITAVKEGNEKVTVSLSDKSVEFNVTVEKVVTLPVFETLSISYDLVNQCSAELTLQPKEANDFNEFTYELKEETLGVVIEGNTLKVNILTVVEKVVVVVAKYGDELTDEFNVNINVTASKNIFVENGSFDNGLEGWTLNGEIGGVTDAPTFWNEGFAIFNEGNYFSAYAKDDLEKNEGTLTSSTFTLAGTGYITFMLGGAGNENCYITIEDTLGNVLALYRNYGFKDFPLGEYSLDERKEMIGNTVNLANLVKYRANLSAYLGKELRLVVHDYATSGWGVVFFDELNTFHTVEPTEGLEAVNELADFTALKALVDNELTSLGDYTTASFEKYQAAIANAKEGLNNYSLKQNKVDELCAAVNNALNSFEVREIEVVKATDEVKVIIEDTLIISYLDYFNTNNLSSVTFNATLDNTTLTYTTSDNSIVIDTNVDNIELHTFTITLEALYKNEVKKTVVINCEVISDPTPIIKEASLTESIDGYYIDEDYYLFDINDNVINAANLPLNYYVKSHNEWIIVEKGLYSHDLVNTGSHTLVFKVEYEVKEQVLSQEFTLNLNVVDSTNNRLYNGDFELGNLDGWTLAGNLGDVGSNDYYWPNDSESEIGFLFNKDGKYMFSAYEGGNEAEYGMLKSSKFVVGGTGYITFKLGGAKNKDFVNLQVIDANTGNILKSYYNELWADRTNDIKSGCTMTAYKADLSDLIGTEVYIRLVDMASGDYGLFFLDSVYTYYTTIPGEEFNLATNIGLSGNVYEMVNGGFETGNTYGWRVASGEEPGKVTNLTGYWGSNIQYGKDGEYLFTALEGQSWETDPNLEGRTGTLRSAVVTLKANAIVTFKLGAAKNDTTGIRFVNAVTGEVIGKFYNTEFNKHDGNEGLLMQYVYQFANETEIECYVEIYDEVTSDWGLVAVDSIVVNAPTKELENSFEAVNIA